MKKLKALVYKNWLQHLLFWVLSFYAIGSFFSISNELKTIDFIYSAFFHIPLIIIVYLNLRWSIPKYLNKERYLRYVIQLIGYLLTGYITHNAIFDFVIPLLPVDFYMVSFTDMDVLFIIFSIYLILTTLLKLSKSWYQLQQIEKEKLSLELNSLKMQINPHFLFNSLNSVYSLALKKSDKAPDLILKLSDLMRYMIYEVSDERVPLSKEIESINNYIELQRTRIGDNTTIEFNYDQIQGDPLIAPLLFFPLIENSFKHGLKGNDKEGFVRIDLMNSHSELVFKIKNNKGQIDDMENNKYGGIGLKNVEKRLGLIYGGNAQFMTNETPEIFLAAIKINWNEVPDNRR